MDHRPHIVVVEDEAAQRQLLLDYLAKQNFRVSGADGGAALRRLVERELPQVVLLDVGLPGEDGFALARWLREKSGRGCSAPISPMRACCAASLAPRQSPARACAWAASCWTWRGACSAIRTTAARRP